jgi:hypothetical protein
MNNRSATEASIANAQKAEGFGLVFLASAGAETSKGSW